MKPLTVCELWSSYGTSNSPRSFIWWRMLQIHKRNVLFLCDCDAILWRFLRNSNILGDKVLIIYANCTLSPFHYNNNNITWCFDQLDKQLFGKLFGKVSCSLRQTIRLFFPETLSVSRLKLIPDQCPDFICKSLLTTYWAPPPIPPTPPLLTTTPRSRPVNGERGVSSHSPAPLSVHPLLPKPKPPLIHLSVIVEEGEEDRRAEGGGGFCPGQCLWSREAVRSL